MTRGFLPVDCAAIVVIHAALHNHHGTNKGMAIVSFANTIGSETLPAATNFAFGSISLAPLP
jgi:hypothetical protein